MGVVSGGRVRIARGCLDRLLRELANAGISKVQLKVGADGKSKVQVKGVGLGLPATLAITPPVTVTLSNSLGVRWESTFSTPKKNTTEQFKAKAP